MFTHLSKLGVDSWSCSPCSELRTHSAPAPAPTCKPCSLLHKRLHRSRLQPLQAIKNNTKEKKALQRTQHGSGNGNGTRHALEEAEHRTGDAGKGVERNNDSTAEDNASLAAKLAAPAGLILGLGLLLGGGYLFKDQLRGFIDYFIEVAEQWGPLGYVAYGGVYTALEVLAVPAVPLTMTAGVIFGPVPGVIVVSGASTAAATLSFLIARYAARDRVLELAEKNNRFKAVDKAIGKNGFKVVTLLRLSPLLPLSLSNYFYGLTSVDLVSYVAGSWLGMLPGTVLYVVAGDYGRGLLGSEEGLGGLPVSRWQVGLGIAVTVAILGYVGQLAKKALDEADAEEAS